MEYMNLEVGYEFPKIVKEEITRVQLVKYAGASGDFNPLHTVEEVGEQAGSGIIAHGMLIMGMVAEAVTTWVPRKQVRNLKVRFKKMTFPGEVIEVVGKVIDKTNDRLVGQVSAMNREGVIKVSGTFEVNFLTKQNTNQGRE